jgi:hypothetical protein
MDPGAGGAVTWTAASLRPRPSWSRPGAFLVPFAMAVICWALPTTTQAQVPDTIPPPDTITVPVPIPPEVMDTVPVEPVPGDTVPADTLPPVPPPRLPEMPPLGPRGWAHGVWEWDRADLLRLPDLSLLHLLERIPGITPVRVASVGQPEGAAVFGTTAAGIRYEVDGYELDPLVSPSFDPARFPLLALEGVRIERTPSGAVVRIRTLEPSEPRPESVIEAGTGDLRTNLFRGTFLAPRVMGGGLGIGFESLGAQTLAGAGANQVGGWLKWTWAREDVGAQVEYRQVSTTQAAVGAGLDGIRRDWVARARHRLGVVRVEAYVGGSAVEDEVGDEAVREGAVQGGVRVRGDVPAPFPLQTSAALRLRDHPRLPAQEIEAAVWSAPVAWLALGGDVRRGRWAQGAGTGSWSVRAAAGPFFGATGFIDASAGTRGLAFATPFPGAEAPGGWRLNLAESGLRAGAEFQRGGLHVGAAALRLQADSVPGFGLLIDPQATRFAGGEATGIEAVVRLPTGWAPLRVEGWFVGLDTPPTWPYLPSEHWHAALVYHHLPLPTGNLEIFGRVLHEVRGRMMVPLDGGLNEVGPYAATNLELSIRVLDVHAFVRWQNMFNRPLQEDVPGFVRPGQHVFYGVKWQFWN